MSYRTRGVFAGDQAVDPATARTEVLAKAFDDVAGEYFEREQEYKQGIEENEDQIQWLRRVAIGAVAVGVVLFVVGLVSQSITTLLVGIVAPIAGVGYSYVMTVRLKDEIKQYREQLAINSPDGSVLSVSQVGVPFYLVPYDDEYLIFDGVGETPTNEIELAHVDTDRLVDQKEELADLVELYEKHVESNHVVSSEFIEEFAPEIRDHRELERPLAQQLDAMRATLKHPETEHREVPGHGTNTVAESIRSLSETDQLLASVDLPEIQTAVDRAEWDQAVASARTLRHDALEEETLEPITESRDQAKELTEPALDRLRDNCETVSAYFEEHTDRIDTTTHKQTCRECLLDRCERLAEEFSLIDEILGETTGEFGTTLTDPDLTEAMTDGGTTAREQYHTDIESRLPEASETLRKAYNSLPDLEPDERCPEHGDVERISVPEDGVLFGTVWRCLYDQFRDGALEAAEDLEQRAADRREQKEQDMVDLAQYEGISDLLEREYRNVDTQEATAEKIDRTFDKLEQRLVEVESQAQSQPQAGPTPRDDESPEEFRERLESRLDQKKQQVRETKEQVLQSYSDDIGALTREFIETMPDGKENIDSVNEEFERFQGHREQLLAETSEHAEVVTDNYRKRLETLTDSRSALDDAIESFVRRREETARAVENLTTPVEQAAGFTRIVVPFWVVCFSQEAETEFTVYPILNRGEPSESPSEGNPYVEHLQAHPTHNYEQFVETVHTQLAGSELLTELRPDPEQTETDPQTFGDPERLRENEAIADTFVDDLKRFQLS